MTSGDDLTIQDGAVEFWQLGGNDLFALADGSGRVVAAYTKSNSSGPSLNRALKSLLASPSKHYLINGGSLYQCSLLPLYFGSAENGTLLGYVISGISIERTVRQISAPTVWRLHSSARATSSPARLLLQPGAAIQSAPVLCNRAAPTSRWNSGRTRYLAATEDLTSVCHLSAAACRPQVL